MFSWTISLTEGIYYWAVSACNSVTGPLSEVSSVIVCISYPPRFTIVSHSIIQTVRQLLSHQVTGIQRLHQLHLHGIKVVLAIVVSHLVRPVCNYSLKILLAILQCKLHLWTPLQSVLYYQS